VLAHQGLKDADDVRPLGVRALSTSSVLLSGYQAQIPSSEDLGLVDGNVETVQEPIQPVGNGLFGPGQIVRSHTRFTGVGAFNSVVASSFSCVIDTEARLVVNCQ
jgi:hypothetical protein